MKHVDDQQHISICQANNDLRNAEIECEGLAQYLLPVASNFFRLRTRDEAWEDVVELAVERMSWAWAQEVNGNSRSNRPEFQIHCRR
jgi:hypothetical protein